MLQELKPRLEYCSGLLLMDTMLTYIASLKTQNPTATDPFSIVKDHLKSVPQQKWVVTRQSSQVQHCMKILQSLQLSSLFEGKRDMEEVNSWLILRV